MTAPLITKLTADRTRLSHVDGFDEAHVTITFDQDIEELSVNLNGTDHLTGTIIETYKAKTVGDMALNTVSVESTLTNKNNITVVLANVDFTEIVISDFEILVGDNVVNFYGKNSLGEWSIKN